MDMIFIDIHYKEPIQSDLPSILEGWIIYDIETLMVLKNYQLYILTISNEQLQLLLHIKIPGCRLIPNKQISTCEMASEIQKHKLKLHAYIMADKMVSVSLGRQ